MSSIQKALTLSKDPGEIETALLLLDTIICGPQANTVASRIEGPLLQALVSHLQSPKTGFETIEFVCCILTRLVFTTPTIATRLLKLGIASTLVKLLNDLDALNDHLNEDNSTDYVLNLLERMSDTSTANQQAINRADAHLAITTVLSNSTNLSTLKTGLSTLYSLAQDSFCDPKLSSITFIAVRLAKHSDEDVQQSALKLLACLAQFAYSEKEAEELVPTIIEALSSYERYNGCFYALRAIETLIRRSTKSSTLLIDVGILPTLLTLLKVDRRHTDAIYSIFTIILQGPPSHINSCLDANIHLLLLKVVNNRATNRATSEKACWALLNVLYRSDPDDFHRLVTSPLLIQTYFHCLSNGEDELARHGMLSIHRILAFGDSIGTLCYDPDAPCTIAPTNPILDYLYAMRHDMLELDEISLSAAERRLVQILENVGTGHHSAETSVFL